MYHLNKIKNNCTVDESQKVLSRYIKQNNLSLKDLAVQMRYKNISKGIRKVGQQLEDISSITEKYSFSGLILLLNLGLPINIWPLFIIPNVVRSLCSRGALRGIPSIIR